MCRYSMISRNERTGGGREVDEGENRTREREECTLIHM